MAYKKYSRSPWVPRGAKYCPQPSIYIPSEYRYGKTFDDWSVRQGYVLGRLSAHYQNLNNQFQESIKRHYSQGKTAPK